MNIEIISEDIIFDNALKIAEEIHPRAIDAYFISTANLTNSVLISNDKIMVNNSKNYVESFYLLEKLEEALSKVRELKKNMKNKED